MSGKYFLGSIALSLIRRLFLIIRVIEENKGCLMLILMSYT